MKYRIEYEVHSAGLKIGGGSQIMEFDKAPKPGQEIKVKGVPNYLTATSVSAEPLIDEVNNLVSTSEMIGIEMVINERMDQVNKGRTPSYDATMNSSGQLITAARRLLAASDGHYPGPPLGWDPVIWNRMIEKPEEERKVIAAALIIADLDRRYYIENNR